MSDLRRRFDAVRGKSPLEAARLAYRKLVYRRVRMGRYGISASDAVKPEKALTLPVEVWGADRYESVAGTSEYLTEADLEAFRRQASHCIVVLDQERVVASSWMTSGSVYVHELHRTLEVPPGEHFSCRSYVSPEYRGQALLSHMIHSYTEQLGRSERVWGLVYYWNAASVRSLANIGWDLTGDYWTSWLFGRQRHGEVTFAARPAFDGDDVVVP